MNKALMIDDEDKICVFILPNMGLSGSYAKTGSIHIVANDVPDSSPKILIEVLVKFWNSSAGLMNYQYHPESRSLELVDETGEKLENAQLPLSNIDSLIAEIERRMKETVSRW